MARRYTAKEYGVVFLLLLFALLLYIPRLEKVYGQTHVGMVYDLPINLCSDSSGSGTAQSCTTSPVSFTPTTGIAIIYQTTTANTGDVTVNVNALGAKHIRKSFAAAVLGAGDLPANVPVVLVYDGTFWELFSTGNASVSSPGGRLTLTTGTPVMTADATAQTTVFYDSYVSQTVSVFNGTSWVALTITNNEVSMGLDATVPHIASGSLYDVFGVNSSGLALCAGPAWSSTTSRGTGAGTTQIHRQSTSGIWTNQNALTHCWGGASGLTDFGSVAVDQATYLGTLDATANGQTGMQFKPAAASGGSNNVLGLYNAYNQVLTGSFERDSTASWTYSTQTWRATNSSNSNRITYVDGLQQSQVTTACTVGSQSSAGSVVAGEVGVDLDSTTATPTLIAFFQTAATTGSGGNIGNTNSFAPSLGLHFLQQMEFSSNTNVVQFDANGFQALQINLLM